MTVKQIVRLVVPAALSAALLAGIAAAQQEAHLAVAQGWGESLARQE